MCGRYRRGGAVLGGLAGAAVETVTLPFVGTVSGTAVGFWGGALTGMAASCNDITIVVPDEELDPVIREEVYYPN